MNLNIGDKVHVKSKRYLLQHSGRITQIGKKEIEITNGFETVRIRLRDWEVITYGN